MKTILKGSVPRWVGKAVTGIKLKTCDAHDAAQEAIRVGWWATLPPCHYRPESALWTSVAAQLLTGSHHTWVLTTSRQEHHLLLDTCRACDYGLCHQPYRDKWWPLKSIRPVFWGVCSFFSPSGAWERQGRAWKLQSERVWSRHLLCLSKTRLKDTVISFFSDS